ncbi:MAG: hypothetical protein MUO89_09235 [Dehalococcoidia bacterium]|nr:hypothetical protein [Dehalococcoidia bacterium]
MQNSGGFFQGIIILWLGVALFVGLMVFLALAINNWRQSGARWASIAGVFGTLLGLLFTATAISTLKESPSLEITDVKTITPPGGINYVYVSVKNNGNASAKSCTGEITWTDTKTGESSDPLHVVWSGDEELRDILPYGGSTTLYLFVTDTKEPITVVPYYKGVPRPPWSTDPQRFQLGDYLLTLTIRAENTRPRSAHLRLFIGKTWDDLNCVLLTQKSDE